MKKFTLFLIIFLTLTAFLAGYIIVKRETGALNTKTGTILDKFGNEQTNDKNTSLPEEETRLLLVGNHRVSSPTLSSDKSSILYFAKDIGKFSKLNLETGTEEILSEAISNITAISWSPNKKQAMGILNSSEGPVYRVLDLETGSLKVLDPNIRSATFSTDGNLIAYHYLEKDSSVGKFVLSQPDGTYPKTILNTRFKDITLAWPSKDNITIKTTSELYSLNDRGELKKLIDLSLGLEENWSPSGNKVLFSIFSDDPDNPGTFLWLKKGDSEKIALGLPGSAYTCAWSIDDINIFCAIPVSQSTDDIYKIDTEKNSYEVIGEPLAPISELILSPLEDRIFFVDSTTESLYSIKIK